MHLQRAHQFVRIARHQPRQIGPDFREALLRNFVFARHLRRLQIIIDETAYLVLDLIGGQSVVVAQRRQHTDPLGLDRAFVEIRQSVTAPANAAASSPAMAPLTNAPSM